MLVSAMYRLYIYVIYMFVFTINTQVQDLIRVLFNMYGVKLGWYVYLTAKETWHLHCCHFSKLNEIVDNVFCALS